MSHFKLTFDDRRKQGYHLLRRARNPPLAKTENISAPRVRLASAEALLLLRVRHDCSTCYGCESNAHSSNFEFLL